MKTEFIELPTLTRSVAVVPSSLNEEAGTVEVIASTGSTVRRSGWLDDFDERLVISPDTVDLSRLNAGAPVLDTHSWEGGTEAIRGITVPGSARIDGGNVIETLQVDRETPSGAELWRKIKAGFVRFLSIGYDADFKRTRAKDRTDGGDVDLLESTMLRIFETSFVPAGADPGAAIRSAPKGATRRYAVRSTEETAMDPKAEPTQSTTAQTDESATRAAEERAEKAAFERMTVARSAAKVAGVTDEQIIEKVARECRTHEQIKARFLDLAEEGQRGKMPGATQVTMGRGHEEKQADLIGGAMLARCLQGVDQRRIELHNARAVREGIEKIERPSDPEMVRTSRMRMLDLAEQFLRSRNIDTKRMGPNEIAATALGYRSGGGGLATTSDFSSLLGNAANKMLWAGYAEVTSPWRELIGTRMDRPDFKEFSIYRRSAAPDLEVVNEHGEVKRAGYNASTPLTGQLATAGIEVGFTRQMLINDDLNAFAQQTLGLGDSAMRFEDDTVIIDLLYGNPTLGDSVAFFDASRGNLSTDVGTPDTTALVAVAGLFAKMTETIRKAGNNAGTTTRKIHQDVGGFLAAFAEATAINAILRPEGYVPTSASGALPNFLAGLQAYRDARLSIETSSPDVWFGFSRNRRAIAYGYLSGENGPRLSQFAAAGTDGVVFQLIHDWYGAVADPYAMVRVPKS